MTPSNAALADALAEVAALLRIGRRERFRVRAYEDAARLVGRLPVPVEDLAPGELARFRGVGPTIVRLADEHRATGTLRYLDELRADHPAGIGALLQVQGVSQRAARALSEAGVRGLADLAAMDEASLAAVEGVGARTAGVILRGVGRTALRRADPMLLRTARREAASLAAWCAALPGVTRALVAGEVRRGVEAPTRLDVVLVAAEPPAVLTEIDARLEGGPRGGSTARGRGGARRPAPTVPVLVLERDDAGRRVLTDDARIADLVVAATADAGMALLRATGDGAHVAAVLGRAPDGARTLRVVDERGAYAAAGLPWIVPPLRDGDDAVERAARGEPLPELVGLGDLAGDLHVHTDWSGDGKDPAEALVRAALARGYAYVAFTDHAEDLSINGLSREQVLARRNALADLRDRYPGIALLDAAELNIGADGGLDYDPEFLLGYDVTVASVHSLLHAPRAQQTARILAAIASPSVAVIGHPVGRLIGHRPGAAIDLEAIAQAAAETGTALEVNGSPRRLDLDAAMVRAALTAGATIACDSDAHSVRELGYVDEAVAVARRGWATRADVLNARDLRGLLRFAAAKRSRA